MSQNGKGDTYRPVHWPTYAANYDAIFNANRPVGGGKSTPAAKAARVKRGQATPRPTPTTTGRIGQRRLLPPATPVPRGKAR